MPCRPSAAASAADPAAARRSFTPCEAYTGRPVRELLRKRGITARIARRGIEESGRLGRHRWVVEFSFAWAARFRRLVLRYERRTDIHLAFATLAAALVCLGQINRFC
jgi:transposase